MKDIQVYQPASGLESNRKFLINSLLRIIDATYFTNAEKSRINQTSYQQITTNNAPIHMTQCPRCGSPQITKRGFDTRKRQRYSCGTCKRSFTSQSEKYTATRLSRETWEAFIVCHVDELSLRRTSEECGISLKTAFHMRRRILSLISKCLQHEILCKDNRKDRALKHEPIQELRGARQAVTLAPILKQSLTCFIQQFPMYAPSEMPREVSPVKKRVNLPLGNFTSISARYHKGYCSWQIWRFVHFAYQKLTLLASLQAIGIYRIPQQFDELLTSYRFIEKFTQRLIADYVSVFT